MHLARQPLPLLVRRRQPRRLLQFGVGAARSLRGHADRQADREFDDDRRVATEVVVDEALDERAGDHHHQPGEHARDRARDRIAAEIVALVAHNVVGQDWLSSAHCEEATTSVDRINATTTTISASTHDGRLPKPWR